MITHKELNWLQGDGDFEQEIVGESFYQGNIESIAGYLYATNYEQTYLAILTLDNNNQYDANAVAVSIDGLQVGNLNKSDAKKFRKKVSQFNQSGAKFQTFAQIRGGGKFHWGVVLDMDLDATTSNRPTTRPPLPNSGSIFSSPPPIPTKNPEIYFGYHISHWKTVGILASILVLFLLLRSCAS